MGVFSKIIRKFQRHVCITDPQSLWKRYAVGFALVVVTIGAAHYASIRAISASEMDAKASHISTQQIMLSQRILFLMRESDRNPSLETEARLASAIRLFESSHEWLTTRQQLSPALNQLYFENDEFPLDYFSRRFVKTARFAMEAQGQVRANMENQLVALGQQNLLSALNTASRLHEQRSRAQTRWLQRLEAIALGAALIVLFLEAAVIFIPAQISVSRAIRRLKRRSNQLTASYETLKNRNEELVAARKNLTHAANHDALTGLLNRRALYDFLTNQKPTPESGDVALSVLKIDLDRFKSVNDTLGHKVGDDVLIAVANILLSQARSDDLVSRIGGDEFVIVVKAPRSMDALESLGTRIVDAISKPMKIDGATCRIGASVGFTMATSSVATPDQLLIEADLALYEAKRAGRGQVFSYSGDLRTEIDTREALFAEITHALAEDQFVPHLQPQIFTGSGKIYGCEILARWNHPTRGIIAPGTFLAAAEEAGMIRQIDLIMVEKGLDLLEQFRARGMEVPSISINASPDTLRDPNLPDRLLQEVLARGLSPQDLTVEVLESTLIESEDDEAIQTIENLTGSGFAVVLDDFGTGYASMSNLSRLRFDGLKLDRSLVEPVPNARAESIIGAVVALSRNLGMRVVAEGVENDAHYERVKALGCDVVQGYRLGYPMPAEAFADWYDTFMKSTQKRQA
ncbi:EAL domain-containing protein [Roseobacter sp. YSTF-M11]|uniref:EAL domain-containing protein n=1 Tax=Roseobacter insulae TaxID=2859783 RepID=A0A9X1FUQ3_9RHOB|nr:EAL domain-containing protein [Roseobacter insulae]MBW4708007.1 EAL domain-containing protein [Roseobacter insulae]